VTDLPVSTRIYPIPQVGPQVGTSATVGDYFALMKPRVMSLVIFTALVGMVLAPGPVNPVLGAIALLALAVGAGASAALNMWYDADIDAGMARTAGRPIPRGRVSRQDALAFGGALALFAVMVMGFAGNGAAAALLAFTIAFYVLVYTMWLKRRTAQNIVIGGAAGALPPLVGWTAVTGHLAVEPLMLFLIIFLWTPPHFWALALYREGDYAKVGVPMMPVVAGTRSTCRQIALYSVLLFASSLMPLFLHMTGAIYAALVVPAGIVFIGLSLRLWANLGRNELFERRARQLFGFSLIYLTLLFSVLLADRFLPGAL
jgi:protoheme IX farnesyltransferase